MSIISLDLFLSTSTYIRCCNGEPSLLYVLDSSSGSFFARFCSKEYLPLEPSNCFSKDSVPKQIVDSFTSMKNVTYDRVSTSMIRALRFGNLSPSKIPILCYMTCMSTYRFHKYRSRFWNTDSVL